MQFRLCVLLWFVIPLSAAVIADIRGKLAAGDLLSADALAADFCAAHGENSECVASLAWLARGALMLGQSGAAADYLARTKELTAKLLGAAKIEDDPFLLSAVGNSIETQAKMLAAQGKQVEAVAFLKQELAHSKLFALRARIQKNINLLSLEGKPAPKLDAAYSGKPVLLFLWAHWCGDCKAQAPTIGRIQRKYAARGLTVIAPTRLYGSVPKVENATAEQETQEIEKVWKQSYADLGGVPHPVDEDAMLEYGVSSTPTLVLIDRQGIVRMYRPYRMSEAAMSKEIEAMLGNR